MKNTEKINEQMNAVAEELGSEQLDEVSGGVYSSKNKKRFTTLPNRNTNKKNPFVSLPFTGNGGRIVNTVNNSDNDDTLYET